MELTFTQLAYICTRASPALLILKLQPLKDSFSLAEINSEKRGAMYIAQLAHESNEFRQMEENLNYSEEALLKIWPHRFNPVTAKAFARQPERIANFVYANRNGNGDELGGDGWKYRGRGAIGLTFAANYQACGMFLGIDLLGHPDLASTDQYCFAVAAWYWRTHGLNAYADIGDLDGCTQKINGGLTGIELRRILYIRGMEAFIAPSLV